MSGDDPAEELDRLEQTTDRLRQAQRYDEALVGARRLVDATTELLGPADERSVAAIRGLAVTLLDADRPSEAAEVVTTALDQATEDLGPDNDLVLALRLTDGMARRAIGDLDVALEQLEALVHDLGRFEVEGSVQAVEVATELVVTALGARPTGNDLTRIVGHLERQVQERGRSGPSPQPADIEAMTVLSMGLQEAGRSAAARSVSLRAVELATAGLGPEHPSTADARTNLQSLALQQAGLRALPAGLATGVIVAAVAGIASGGWTFVWFGLGLGVLASVAAGAIELAYTRRRPRRDIEPLNLARR